MWAPAPTISVASWILWAEPVATAVARRRDTAKAAAPSAREAPSAHGSILQSPRPRRKGRLPQHIGWWGPTWSAQNNNGCPLDDPGSTTGLGPFYASNACTGTPNAAGPDNCVGFGEKAELNTGTWGAGENYMHMFVREDRPNPSAGTDDGSDTETDTGDNDATGGDGDSDTASADTGSSGDEEVTSTFWVGGGYEHPCVGDNICKAALSVWERSDGVVWAEATISNSAGAVWTSTGTLTSFGVAKVDSEFGALEDAGLDAEYGCVDFDTCDDTTTIKNLRYRNEDGSTVSHTYESGASSVPSSTLSPSYSRIRGFLNAISGCSTSGSSLTIDDDCTGGALPVYIEPPDDDADDDTGSVDTGNAGDDTGDILTGDDDTASATLQRVVSTR